jgi:hypothetical protein
VADPSRPGDSRPARQAPGAPTPAQRAEAKRSADVRAGHAGRAADASARTTARAEAQRTGRERLIYAKNWRTPLVVDIVMGTIVFVGGVVLSVNWSPVVGGGLGALGALYVLLAVRRWRLWAALRREAGLTPGGGEPGSGR